jgi:hypothetical protein
MDLSFHEPFGCSREAVARAGQRCTIYLIFMHHIHDFFLVSRCTWYTLAKLHEIPLPLTLESNEMPRLQTTLHLCPRTI